MCVVHQTKVKRGDRFLRTMGEGIWLGIREESGEVMIGTKDGIIKTRTIRRKGSPHKDGTDANWTRCTAPRGTCLEKKYETRTSNLRYRARRRR